MSVVVVIVDYFSRFSAAVALGTATDEAVLEPTCTIVFHRYVLEYNSVISSTVVDYR